MFVTHLECSATGELYDADQPHNLSRAGKPLLVRYDLDAVGDALTKEALATRPTGMRRTPCISPPAAGSRTTRRKASC